MITLPSEVGASLFLHMTRILLALLLQSDDGSMDVFGEGQGGLEVIQELVEKAQVHSHMVQDLVVTAQVQSHMV
jgi:hypothetical protein